jgi:hypothetical protein
MKMNLNIRHYVIWDLFIAALVNCNIANAQRIVIQPDKKQITTTVTNKSEAEIFKPLETILNAHKNDLSVLFKSGVDGLKDREIDAYLKAEN